MGSDYYKRAKDRYVIRIPALVELTRRDGSTDAREDFLASTALPIGELEFLAGMPQNEQQEQAKASPSASWTYFLPTKTETKSSLMVMRSGDMTLHERQSLIGRRWPQGTPRPLLYCADHFAPPSHGASAFEVCSLRPMR